MTTTTDHQFDLNAMKDKIAKLLAKAEGTDNEAERDAFTAKAQALMVRLGIDAAELEAAGTVKPEDIVEVHRDYTGVLAPAMVDFAHSVARGFGNLNLLTQTFRYPKDTRRVFLIGHKTDVELVLQLLDSLELQAHSAMKVWAKDNRDRLSYHSQSQRRTANRSFMVAFGRTVGNRLAESRAQETQDANVSTGAALVLASKADRVQAWVDETYGQLRAARGGMRNGSSLGANGGRAAGNRADIGNTRIGGKGALES